MQALRITPDEFKKLPIYNNSFPTGVVAGKRWKRLDTLWDANKRYQRWLIAEYGEHTVKGKKIKINWYIPIISIRAAI